MMGGLRIDLLSLLSWFSAAPIRRRHAQAEYYPRFFSAFQSKGEVNIPVDAAFVATPEFGALVSRLHVETTSQHRDCWRAPDRPAGTDLKIEEAETEIVSASPN